METNVTLKRFWDCVENGNTVGARSCYKQLREWMRTTGKEPRWGDRQERELFFNFNWRRGECDMRSLMLPDVYSFWDVFRSCTGDKSQAVGWSEPFPFEDYSFKTGKRKMEEIEISSYCSISRAGTISSIHVRAHDALYDLIRQQMLAAGVNDRISWELIVRQPSSPHKRGNTLIIARNSVIIGSRWVAIIETATLPDFDQCAEAVFHNNKQQGV